MTAATNRLLPLVSLALPQGRVARLAMQLLLAFAGTLLLTVAAKTRVVLGPVDMSMQTLAVFMIGAAFGMRLAVATVLLYLAEGALGFPVFQGTPEKGIGLAYMAGPTAGYLLGFLAAAAIVGRAADKGWDRDPLKLLPAILLAEAAMMALGFGWLASMIGPAQAWQFGVVPFILPDLVKVGLAAALVPAVWTLIPRGPAG